MNVYDTEMMEGIMQAKGWARAGAENEADVILYNTCVVRDHAESRAVARLGQLAKLKRDHPERIIGVTGCLAQKDAEKLYEKLPHVDMLLGTRAIPRLGSLLDRVIATGERQTCVEILDESFPTDIVPVRQRPLKALINIILGCNKNCSYCIVPQTRGREVSRSVQEIVAEARHLAEHGWREITLVGQNVNAYKRVGGGSRNASEHVDFGGLLREVDAALQGVRIRYITSHPRDCNASHISAVADCENVCENFHLPVQSGNDHVLKRMYRGYTRSRYLRLVDQIRNDVPHATLSTDLIVGFPGETDEEFRETMSLVEEVRFDSAYMYMYSPRPGTTAADEFSSDEIPLELKKERLAELIARQEAIGTEINRAAEGSTQSVLIEDLAPRTPGDLLARTRGDKMVIVPGPKEWIGSLKEVRIERSNAHTLFGKILGEGIDPEPSLPKTEDMAATP